MHRITAKKLRKLLRKLEESKNHIFVSDDFVYHFISDKNGFHYLYNSEKYNEVIPINDIDEEREFYTDWKSSIVIKGKTKLDRFDCSVISTDNFIIHIYTTTILQHYDY